ncbi:MAG TPA: LysR family transcriptional regulator [Solirubrobacteraceae bacterium]|jgi:DNA-binding transcriptional LysR family regulator|nr:LysR family transcriptional regulator [Solirubrobacteraceae bacterium]
MAVELRHLRFLVAVSETGSVSGAARRLYMTQPAVTIALRNLERDIGVTLLQRHSRGVDLTPAGLALLAHAQDVIAQVAEATQDARDAAAAPGNTGLTIGLLPATFSWIPRTIIDAFRARYPQIEVASRELSYIGHTKDLSSGRVDVAFLWPPYDEPNLRFEPLSEEPRLLGVAEHHPLGDRDSVALDDILDLPFPGFHPASSGGWFANWFFDDIRGAPAATTRDQAATPFEMAFAVQQGRAIAPAAQSFANAFPADGVRWLPITDAPAATLALAWNPCHRNPATRAFIRVGRALRDSGALGSTGIASDHAQRDPARQPNLGIVH